MRVRVRVQYTNLRSHTDAILDPRLQSTQPIASFVVGHRLLRATTHGRSVGDRRGGRRAVSRGGGTSRTHLGGDSGSSGSNTYATNSIARQRHLRSRKKIPPRKFQTLFLWFFFPRWTYDATKTRVGTTRRVKDNVDIALLDNVHCGRRRLKNKSKKKR